MHVEVGTSGNKRTRKKMRAVQLLTICSAGEEIENLPVRAFRGLYTALTRLPVSLKSIPPVD